MAHKWGEYQTCGGREAQGREERGALRVSLVSPQINNLSHSSLSLVPTTSGQVCLVPTPNDPFNHSKTQVSPFGEAFCTETFWKPGAVGCRWALAVPPNCLRGSRPSPAEISQGLESRSFLSSPLATALG